MAFMRRDVNLGLLLLIVAALLMFSGFTVYYQTTFKNVSKNYETKLNELDKITKELETKRTELNQTSVQLQLNKQKESDLSSKFVDTKSERDQLEADKKKLEVDLASTKADLAATSTKLADTQEKLAEQVSLVTSLNAEVVKWKNKYNDAKDDLDACEGN